MSPELEQYVWERRCDLLYKAWVQVRYHRKRQRFFDLCDKLTKSVTVILGASMLGQALRDYLPLMASLISAIGLLALVFGYGDRKQLHKELAERAATLVSAIEAVPGAQLTPDKTAGWASDFAELCAKAPPPLKTLTLICEREQSTADGHPEHIPRAGFLARFFSDFI